MPAKSAATAAREPCIFCNSLSHRSTSCNSNMKGRRELLVTLGQNFMLDDKIPDFASFPINELRFIASNYMNFQKQILKQHMDWYFCKYITKEFYSHIPFTLTKTRLIKNLQIRWNMYEQIRNNKKIVPFEDEDCPICLDRISTCCWNTEILNWDIIVTKTSRPEAMFDGNIKTKCGHTFCGDCWEMHTNANSKIEYREDCWYNEATGNKYVSCPMCRCKLIW